MTHSWRVLVADDDVEICALIQAILKSGPYALTVVNDAETALERVQVDGPFDIIICDFMLPGMTGIEFIARLRANAAWERVLVVMISGHSNAEMDLLARDAGANAFLGKPFTLAQLRSTLQLLLDGRLSIASSR